MSWNQGMHMYVRVCMCASIHAYPLKWGRMVIMPFLIIFDLLKWAAKEIRMSPISGGQMSDGRVVACGQECRRDNDNDIDIRAILHGDGGDCHRNLDILRGGTCKHHDDQYSSRTV